MQDTRIAQDFLQRADKAHTQSERVLCLHDGLSVLGAVPMALEALGMELSDYQKKVDAEREDGDGGTGFSESEIALLRRTLERALR